MWRRHQEAEENCSISQCHFRYGPLSVQIISKSICIKRVLQKIDTLIFLGSFKSCLCIYCVFRIISVKIFFNLWAFFPLKVNQLSTYHIALHIILFHLLRRSWEMLRKETLPKKKEMIWYLNRKDFSGASSSFKTFRWNINLFTWQSTSQDLKVKGWEKPLYLTGKQCQMDFCKSEKDSQSCLFWLLFRNHQGQ